MTPRNDLTLIRGETLQETVAINGLVGPGDLPCSMEMVLRMSRGGRKYATIASQNIDFQFVGEGRVAIYAYAADLIDIPAVTYVYDLYAQCATTKKVLSSGYFDLLPNAVSDHDMDDIGVLAQGGVALDGAPAIFSTNHALSLCCDTYQPLYFEVHDPDGVKEAWVESGFGDYKAEAYYKGSWVADPSFSARATRYRLSFVRFPEYKPYTPNWEKGMWKGGTVNCPDCPYSPDCEDFSIAIHAKDVYGNESQKKFWINVVDSLAAGTAPAGAFDDVPRITICDDSFGIVGIGNALSLLAQGCSTCAGYIGGAGNGTLIVNGCSTCAGIII